MQSTATSDVGSANWPTAGRPNCFPVYLVTVLGTVTGLLFSVTFWHVGMREHLAGTDSSFFESFYFISYLMFAYVALVGYWLACRRVPRWLEFHEHAIPKMLFWPVVGTAVLAATLGHLFLRGAA